MPPMFLTCFWRNVQDLYIILDIIIDIICVMDEIWCDMIDGVVKRGLWRQHV